MTRQTVSGAAAICLALAATAARAEVPAVVADIAPVAALAARVMDGVGTPDTILRPGASPHSYALRPSEAAALSRADLVIWVGPELTPWLADRLEALSGDATALELLEVSGTRTFAFRDSATFGQDHDHDAHGDAHDHEEHAHEDEHDQEEHAHEDEHAHEEHDHEDEEHADHDEHADDEHADDHDHDHTPGAVDPHAWLYPQNAETWLDAIAAELARLDPANADTYATNAEAGRAEIAAATAAARDAVADIHDVRLFVEHDAHQYLEAALDLTVLGAVSDSDAAEPGPARMAALRDAVAEGGEVCFLVEPGHDPRLAAAITGETGAHVVELDPLGRDLEPGPGFYPALIESLGEALRTCH